MNIEEIKKNAPEGATHYRYNHAGVRYFLVDDCRLFIYASWHDWIKYLFPINQQELKPL